MFDDFFNDEDFVLDPEDLQNNSGEEWETGIEPDMFSSGETPDIWSTKD
jgi:hypothetical protein